MSRSLGEGAPNSILARWTPEDDPDLKDVAFEFAQYDSTLLAGVHSVLGAFVDESTLNSFIQQHQRKPVFGIGVNASLEELVAWGLAPSTAGLSLLIEGLKPFDVATTSFSIYFDIADLYGFSQDGEEGFTTVWIDAGFTAFTLGAEIPILSNFAAGVVPFQATDIDADVKQGFEGSNLFQAEVGDIAVYFGPDDFESELLDSEWIESDLELFEASASLQLGNVKYNPAMFEVNTAVLRAAFTTIFGGGIESLLMAPSSDVAEGGIVPLFQSSWYDIALEAVTGQFGMPWVRSATTSSDDHGNDLGSATHINVGDIVEGRISNTGAVSDQDLFRIQIPADGSYFFRVAGTDFRFDAEMEILAENGESIAFDDDDGGLLFDPGLLLPANGGEVLFIEVRGFNGTETGNYVLSVIPSFLNSPVSVSSSFLNDSDLASTEISSLSIRFDQDVENSISIADLELTRATVATAVLSGLGASGVDLSGAAVTYDALQEEARWDFSTLDSPLLPGDYTARINANEIFDMTGNRLDGDDDGLAGGDWTLTFTVESPLAGDYDNSGTVDQLDYDLWRTSFGQIGANLAADGNVDGIVNAADYIVWRNNLGASVGGNSLDSAAAVGSASIEIADLEAAAEVDVDSSSIVVDRARLQISASGDSLLPRTLATRTFFEQQIEDIEIDDGSMFTSHDEDHELLAVVLESRLNDGLKDDDTSHRWKQPRDDDKVEALDEALTTLRDKTMLLAWEQVRI